MSQASKTFPMQKSKFYHQHTDYDKEPGGLRKLDFIVCGIKKYLKKKESQIKILDVGCGNGNISLPLASLGFQVLGIDLDRKSIENVKRRNKFKNAQFEVKNIKDISEKEKFDCIIASEVIEHITNPLQFLNFLKKILDLKGILIISIPNGTSLEENIRKFTTHTSFGRKIKKILKKKIREEKIQTLAQSPHLHFFSLSQFKKLLALAGFEILTLQNSAAIFKEAYYLFLRFFIKRGSKLFHFLDYIDNYLSGWIPKTIGDGWTMIVKAQDHKNTKAQKHENIKIYT